ncbi:Serine/threonine-protein kinase grp [Gryllus bimaculatus]|nr:Serine/threonine-protein kinase grp [Gryllus bimaculatus]
MEGQEFVDGWIRGQILGEGAYGEVQLLLNKSTGEAVAMKVIELGKLGVDQMVKKEVCIHRRLNHQNIIKCFGSRQEANKHYIFLEYASGGELFDRIEPDVGMEEWQAQKYFKQLLNGVEYMHSQGIAHRDLKPENLLLDNHDNLKISDFGMATIFRFRGQERPLEKRCGTLPYLAPEVMLRTYLAEPADIWACGIILVAMLAGELPWDQPTADCPEFMAWKDRKWHTLSPWTKIDTVVLSLVQRLLLPLPKSRAKIPEIKGHRWMQKKFSRNMVGVIRPAIQVTPPRPTKRLCSDVDLPSPEHVSTRLCQSQPETRIVCAVDTDCDDSPNADVVSFSQPAQFEDLLLSSQLHSTQSTTTSQNVYQKLVRRMTRFFVKLSCEQSIKLLLSALGDHGWSCKATTRQVTVTCVDKRKMPLTFKVNVLDMDGQTLLDFRLSKGCGLEFKKCFLKIKESLEEVVEKGPVTWPIAIATNTVP